MAEGTEPRSYEYRMDRDGTLWLGDMEVVNEAVVRLFLGGLEEDAGGRFLLRCGREVSYLVPDDTPYVIRAVTPVGPRDRPEGFVAHFGAGYAEPLAPQTLHVGERDVLYARVRGGQFRARFTRGAYAQLAEHVVEAGAGYALRLRGGDAPIELGANRP